MANTKSGANYILASARSVWWRPWESYFVQARDFFVLKSTQSETIVYELPEGE